MHKMGSHNSADRRKYCIMYRRSCSVTLRIDENNNIQKERVVPGWRTSTEVGGPWPGRLDGRLAPPGPEAKDALEDAPSLLLLVSGDTGVALMEGGFR